VTLAILFVVVVVINGLFFLLFSTFSFGMEPAAGNTGQYPVSVIVCARNEAKNLKKNIPLWLEQDYPDFELVLINDDSSDDTLKVIEYFVEKDNRVVLVDVKRNEKFWGKKKYALTLGIRKARHTRLLFTDADCSPASRSWIARMATLLSTEKQIVLGHGAYQKQAGLLNALIRFETTMTALQYFSSALLGRPYMGVGRNLAYTSNLFYEQAGFTGHIQIDSGDDDLFVQQAATAENTALCIVPDAFTYSAAHSSWRGWIGQKARHSTTAYHYRWLEKGWLGLYYLANLSFWILLVTGLTYNWHLFIAIGLCRLAFQYLLLGRGFKRLQEPGLIWAIPFLELFLVLSQLVIFIGSFKKRHWR
jgi:glycosyltransferase involved in cell wall biosynthesis